MTAAEIMTIHLEMDFTAVRPLDETMDLLQQEIMVCFIETVTFTDI